MTARSSVRTCGADPTCRGRVRTASLTVACVILGAIVSAQTAGPRFPTNEDLRHTRTLSDPQLSPDGRLVLFGVTESTADGAASHLWVVDVHTNTARQLTSGPRRGERQGRWSPDGQAVYFLASRGDHAQVFRLPMNGGEAVPYDVRIVPPVDRPPAATSPVAVDVLGYAIAPDGRTAALVIRDPETAGEAKQKKDKADARAVNQDPHGVRVYLLDLATSAITAVGIAPDVQEAEWSHRSDRLAVVTAPMNGASDLGPDNALWIVDVETPAMPRRLTRAPSTVGGVRWSAGDTRLFAGAQAEADAPPGYQDLMALGIDDGAATNLSRDFRGTVAGRPIPDGDGGVIVPADQGTQGGYVRFAVGGPTATSIALGRGVVRSLATNDRHTGWVYERSSSGEPSALYFTTALGSQERRLDAPATAGAAWRAVTASVVRWSSDGRTIEGLLYLPPAAATSKVPLIVDVHGGPSGVWTESYSPFAQFLVGQGWAVLKPNPRGSTGYGTGFAAANRNDLGGGDYRDIMAGVDFVIAHHPIDPGRLGLYGYSYGGEMAGFVVGKTDRFKAIVSGAPVTDQFSEYGTEDNSWYDRWYFGKPWERMADAWRQSPLAWVGTAKTPFLLLHGEDDSVDPLGQSQEMYRALRQVGVPVQLVIYPRENHGPLSGGITGRPSAEPWHGFDARQRIVRLFQSAFVP